MSQESVSELSRRQIRNYSNPLFDMHWSSTEVTCTDHTWVTIHNIGSRAYATIPYLFRFEVQTFVAASHRQLKHQTLVPLSNGGIISHDYVSLERFRNGLPHPPPEPHRDSQSQFRHQGTAAATWQLRDRRLSLRRQTAHLVHISTCMSRAVTVGAQLRPQLCGGSRNADRRPWTAVVGRGRSAGGDSRPWPGCPGRVSE